MTNSTPILLTITGPTATGKTALAVAVARALDGEIISADSRQVFRGMDIGTGKDLADYSADGRPVPYHLIDIHDPGYEYNVYQFQNDFIRAFQSIVAAGRQPILCGGTGLYVDAVVRNFPLSHAPVAADFRASVADVGDEELTRRLDVPLPWIGGATIPAAMLEDAFNEYENLNRRVELSCSKEEMKEGADHE